MLCHPLLQLTPTNTGIEKQTGIVGFDIDAVAVGAGLDGERHHGD